VAGGQGDIPKIREAPLLPASRLRKRRGGRRWRLLSDRQRVGREETLLDPFEDLTTAEEQFAELLLPAFFRGQPLLIES
jgi:hypothetical protein